MEYGRIKLVKSILPADFDDVMSFFIQQKLETKMMLIPKSNLAIFDISPANVIDEMI